MCESNHDIVIEVKIVNKQGLHARPVMQFVDIASGFQASIAVDRGEGTERVDGKSPMHMMLLAAPQGTTLRIMASGEDAPQATEALEALVGGGFGEPC